MQLADSGNNSGSWVVMGNGEGKTGSLAPGRISGDLWVYQAKVRENASLTWSEKCSISQYVCKVI